jgi:ABC-2 type transport system ATP-binding protein
MAGVSAGLRLSGVEVVLGATSVLERIELHAPAGAITVLVGPNGSGKTTLLRCAAGIVPAACGAVEIDGVSMQASAQHAKARLGFAVEPARLPAELTPRQCLALFARMRGPDRIPDDTLALACSLGTEPWLDVEIAYLSLGTRQKLGVLLGLLGDPPILLLDEPTNGLDPPSARVLRDELEARARRGRAVLVATYALDLAERLADRVAWLHGGTLAGVWEADELARMRAAGSRLEDAILARFDAAPSPSGSLETAT